MFKQFKDYLAESKNNYPFKIKVAGELPENFQDRLKSALGRCGIMVLEKQSTTPVQSLPLDFPEKRNVEVHIFEVVCEYPITAPELVSEVKALGLDESCFRIRGSSEPSEIDQATNNEVIAKDGLLNTQNYQEVSNAKHKDYFGDDFNKNFLKDLQKTAKARNKEEDKGEYKLPKAKEDKAGAKSAIGS